MPHNKGAAPPGGECQLLVHSMPVMAPRGALLALLAASAVLAAGGGGTCPAAAAAAAAAGRSREHQGGRRLQQGEAQMLWCCSSLLYCSHAKPNEQQANQPARLRHLSTGTATATATAVAGTGFSPPPPPPSPTAPSPGPPSSPCPGADTLQPCFGLIDAQVGLRQAGSAQCLLLSIWSLGGPAREVGSSSAGQRVQAWWGRLCN